MSDHIAPDGTHRSNFVLRLAAATAVESFIYLTACGVAAQIVPTGSPQDGVVVACEVVSHGGLAVMALIGSGRAKLMHH